MGNKNSFGEYKWFTVRSAGPRKSFEMGIFMATTRNQFRVKLEKVVHEKFPDVKIPEDFDPLISCVIRGGDAYHSIIVVETKIF